MAVLNKYKILVVDDNKNFLKVLRFLLLDFLNPDQIDEAFNGEEAVNLAAENCYDFIFMDVDMPVMDGIEATSRIKLLKPLTRIFALSLFDNKEHQAAMINAGADEYFTKDNLDEALEILHKITK